MKYSYKLFDIHQPILLNRLIGFPNMFRDNQLEIMHPHLIRLSYTYCRLQRQKMFFSYTVSLNQHLPPTVLAGCFDP